MWTHYFHNISYWIDHTGSTGGASNPTEWGGGLTNPPT